MVWYTSGQRRASLRITLDTVTSEKPILCPSGLCEEGSILIGIVQRSGRIGFIKEKIIVDEEFVRIAHKGRSPEKRFRFAEQCREGACAQWSDGRCGVIDEVITMLAPTRVPDELPPCSIRPECRWFRQRGGRACAVCPEVITNSLLEDSHQH